MTRAPRHHQSPPNGVVHLPILAADPPAGGRARPPRSRMGKWRAVVLALVHIAIAAHIAQWWATGRTMSPVEPSEGMETLETGAVNAGFVFFLAALASTLVLGRLFCGWGCHIVALQDACGWCMKKLGVRPKPFRSRLMIFAPLLLALYMFVWPTVKRTVIVPVADRIDLSIADRLGRPAPLPPDGLEAHFMVQDFWATFPGVMIAVPFLAICGFATVYFLGAKGFCTYGCPYGGFFGVLDRFAVGRIVVDSERCDGHAHCTAVCTSNVRVHEEIREFGMVVDPGCMKCMDCVSACPTNALAFRFAAPAVITSRRGRGQGPAPRERPFDLTWPEEGALALIMLASFLALRGAYARVPMLMAIGLAAITAFLAWKGWELLRRPNVRLPWLQLRYKGRLRPAGWAFAAAVIVWLALVAHTGYIRFHTRSGDRAYERIGVPAQALLAGAAIDLAPEARSAAASAHRHFTVASPKALGGRGLVADPEVLVRRASSALALGDRDDAERSLRAVIDAGYPTDQLTADLAQLVALGGDHAGAESMLRAATADHPRWWACAEALVMATIASGRADEALRVAEAQLAGLGGSWRDAEARGRLSMLRSRALQALGLPAEALAAKRAAAEADPRSAPIAEDLAAALFFAGDHDAAVAEMERAVLLDRQDIARWERLAVLYHNLGRGGDARGVLERAEPWAARLTVAQPRTARHWLTLARLQAFAGDGVSALATLGRGDARAGYTVGQRGSAFMMLRSAGAEAEARAWAAAHGITGVPGTTP